MIIHAACVDISNEWTFVNFNSFPCGWSCDHVTQAKISELDANGIRTDRNDTRTHLYRYTTPEVCKIMQNKVPGEWNRLKGYLNVMS